MRTPRWKASKSKSNTAATSALFSATTSAAANMPGYLYGLSWPSGVLATTSLKKAQGLTALDVAKRLLEEGFHAPTTYFPLIVAEALMIEPTETESLQTLEALCEALERIASETGVQAHEAPRTAPVRRLDEARAARHLIPTYDARLAGEAAEG